MALVAKYTSDCRPQTVSLLCIKKKTIHRSDLVLYNLKKEDIILKI